MTADKDNMRFILNQTEVSVVVCSADMVQPLLSLASECPTLKAVITMEPGVQVCVHVYEGFHTGGTSEATRSNLRVLKFSWRSRCGTTQFYVHVSCTSYM